MNPTFKEHILHIMSAEHPDEIAKANAIRKFTNDYLFSIRPPEMPKKLADIGRRVLSMVDRPFSKEAILTGLNDFDRAFGGLQRPELMVIAGRPTMGKTAFATSIALNVSSKQSDLAELDSELLNYLGLHNYKQEVTPALFVSYANTEEDLALYIISITNDKFYELKRQDAYSLPETEEFLSMGHFLDAHELELICPSDYSIDHLEQICRNAVKHSNIGLVIVDNLQSMVGRIAGKFRHAQIADICQTLKSLAIELNVCILLLCDVNRSAETRGGNCMPMLRDLTDVVSFEEYADKICAVYRPECYDFTEDEDGNSTKGMMEILMLKNNSGMISKIKLARKNNGMLLGDLHPSYYEIDPFGRHEDDEPGELVSGCESPF